jgi:hypothetical protein
VQVHIVHINAIPGDIAIELGVEVKDGLFEEAQTFNPHFGRRKRVHPCNQAYTGRSAVGFEAQLSDFVGACEDGLENDLAGDCRVCVERFDNLLGILIDLFEGLGAVEVLTAGGKPYFKLFEVIHKSSP